MRHLCSNSMKLITVHISRLGIYMIICKACVDTRKYLEQRIGNYTMVLYSAPGLEVVTINKDVSDWSSSLAGRAFIWRFWPWWCHQGCHGRASILGQIKMVIYSRSIKRGRLGEFAASVSNIDFNLEILGIKNISLGSFHWTWGLFE